MVDALGLYIPEICQEEAFQLVQLRRHITKRWLSSVAPRGSWNEQLLKRLWTFSGHVCRQNHQPSKPARVMFGHLASARLEGLARPGPWNTLHALLAKFWATHGLEGDYLMSALDRDSWKTLESHFLAWFLPAEHAHNVEFLPCAPYSSPALLLRSHVKWVRTCFVRLRQMDTTLFHLTVAWLDEVEGFCSWSGHYEQPSAYLAFNAGIQQCLQHLAMLYQPYILQLAVVDRNDWDMIHAHRESLHHVFRNCPCGSWVQLFPLSKKELRHRALQYCLVCL
eukprot:Skav219051  [mRNA]  locus=scaffold1033:29162:30001:+ [translate_table: standard]